MQTGQWAYFTVVHESSGTATIYNNGASITSGAVHTSLNESRASNYIGRSNWANDYYFDGKFDEFRLSSTARSADWIATEYANQNSPSTFFTISAPEDRSVAITSAITNIQGDNIIITFNENIIYSVIPTTDFTLTGTSATIDSITSNSSSITLNMRGNLLANEIITISYTKTSGGINSTQSTDITLENFVNQPITNNVPLPPIFVNAYTNQQGDIITVNFDKVVTLTNTTSPTDFAVNILGIATTSITRHNDTAINLTLDSSISFTSLTSSLTLSYNQTTSNITDANNLSLANFTNQPITINVPFFDLPSLWNTRQKITINSNQITTTLQNFTLLVSISDSALNNSAVLYDGVDIIFTSSDGFTILEHEIESFTNDDTTGTLVAWVRLPTLSSTSDTILYMYYNVSSASSIAYPDVWDSDYEIIYHMDQSTFTANSTLDSSGNDCHATPLSAGSTAFNSNDLVSAQIGNGLNFDGVDNSNGDYLDLPDLEGSLFHNTDFTLSVWVNIDALNSNSRFVDFGNGHEQDNIIFTNIRQIERLTYQIHNADNVQSLTTPRILSLGQWAYLTVVHESSGTATIYHNGTSVVSALLTLNDVNRTSNYIGRANNSAHHYFDGKFDEFRLSSTARSADWIATEYANQNSPSTFFTISAPEDRRVVITSAITNTQGDNIIITFNENIIYSVIPTTDFTLTGTSATIDSITSNSSSITLNLSGNLLSNEIITISYTKTSGGINSTQSTDITLENFVNQPITNNVLPPPIFVSAYTNQQGDIITVNFDKVVTLTNTTSPTDFAVNILGIATTSITRHNDTAINLTLDSSISFTSLTSSLTLSYNQTTSNITNVNKLSLANFTNQPITINVPFFDLPSLWNTRQKITINSNQIVTTLQNFTLLVSISDSALSNSSVLPNGADIIFTSSDGFTILQHEIESFTNNATTGTLVAWVRLPTLSNTNDTILYMYYNVSSAATIIHDNVWDSDYEIIYHMD
ncbi:MAG: DUF2341 domain-containing protein [Candidatus Nitrosoabyssus spongiisocia]|nr:MAG: DUF2341 domain-containing protein [Nitrosopumilaceae archaeon AB1(1)]